MRPEVRVVCPGLIFREGQSIFEAHSSSTLVLLGTRKIIVDTSSRQYRRRVLEGLKDLGFAPEDVDQIVTTHPHGDHTGNDDLFASAERLSLREDEDCRSLAPGVRLVRTPGHTPDSISVFVEAEERYAIVGDAVPTEDNYRKWVPPGVHYDREVALASMKKIIDFAEVVVPGHGPPFRVDR